MTTTPAPTDLDLDTLKALEQAATPGPWDEPRMVQPNMAGRHQWWIKAPGPAGLHATGRDQDVHLVVAMRNALPALLDELAALKATCTCATTYATYEGPEADCAVHGAVRAFNEAVRERDAARAELAKTRAELAKAKAEQGRIAQRMAAALEPYVSPSTIRQALADVGANPATTAEPTALPLLPDIAHLTTLLPDDDAPPMAVGIIPNCARCDAPMFVGHQCEAEPANEPKATCHLPVQNGEPCGLLICRKHGCRVAPQAEPAAS